MQELVIECKIQTNKQKTLCTSSFNITDIVADVKQGEGDSSDVVQYHSPSELYETIDFTLPVEGSGSKGK